MPARKLFAPYYMAYRRPQNDEVKPPSISVKARSANKATVNVSFGECAGFGTEITMGHLAALGFESLDSAASDQYSLVFKVKRIGFQGSLCVKVFHPAFMENPIFRAIFEHEAYRSLQLGHPNIVPTYEVGVLSQGAPYVVSQWIDGISITSNSTESHQVDAISFISQLCDALNHIHSNGWLHGNVSLGSVICKTIGSNNLLVKLLDTSVKAALIAQLPFSFDSLRDSVSPEERFGADPDVRSEIYSLGFVLYEILTGCKFDRELDACHIAERLSHTHQGRALSPIVERCLAADPDERYQQVYDVLQAVESVRGF
ncbi:MAG TPA: protein kinase [Drouetiella sp.]